MAEIDLLSKREELAKYLRTADEGTIQGNLLINHGALHALQFLLKVGVTKEVVLSMQEDIETNIGLIEQIGAERGFELKVIHKMFGL